MFIIIAVSCDEVSYYFKPVVYIIKYNDSQGTERQKT